jgi:hypothetical protein
MRERLVLLCTPQLAAGLREPRDLAGATLLHATAWHHEWLIWLRGAGGLDLQGAREQLFGTVDMCVQKRGARAGCRDCRCGLVRRPDRFGQGGEAF